MSLLKNYGFSIALLGGIILGGIFGIIYEQDTEFVKPIGDIFLNLMFCLIVPLVFFSISSAICNMKQSNVAVSKIMGNVFLIFLITAIITGIISYITLSIYNPFLSMDKGLALKSLSPQSEGITKSTFSQMLVKTFTVSDFSSLFMTANLLPLIIFSIIFGLGTAITKEKVISDFLNGGTQVILKMMNIIMYTAPIGLGCYFAYTVGQLGSGILEGYMHALYIYLILTVICYFGINSIYIYFAGGKKGFFTFWKNILTPSLTAIATSSSAACIPINIEASKKMGVIPEIAETVIPLGTNINKNGSVITGVIKIFFITTIALNNPPIGFLSFFIVVGIAILAASVVGAIPSGGMTAELLICAVFGVDPQLAGILLIISTITDVPATLLNSIGNVVCSILANKFSKEQNILPLNEEIVSN